MQSLRKRGAFPDKILFAGESGNVVVFRETKSDIVRGENRNLAYLLFPHPYGIPRCFLVASGMTSDDLSA